MVNSLTPIKMPQKTKEMENEEVFCYQKALLDRQFLNYPMVISTHVSLFDIMFGERRESAFGFHQLMNSVVVLDEIQSYKNELWGKIICFLQEFSYLLNMKLIIMSATLPNLDLLSGNSSQTVQLMNNRDNYFSHVCFKGRVKISYELLESENIEDELIEHILNQAASKKKILIEFIKKKSAAEFFEKLKVKKGVLCDVEYMSGEDSIWERSRILQNVKESTEGIILVATQVVEAGVDIDMDIGYKNISKLDSEEQFMGRINRSCLRKGEVYFFKLDDPQNVYRDQDVRLDKEFTVENRDMREILVSKNFSKYYEKVLAVLKRTVDELSGEKGLDEFFGNIVGKLNWPKVASAMRLIEESSWSMTVYLARKLQDGQGDEVDGKKLWKEYVELLENFSMDYAEKRVKLSQITSKMNCFLYQIKQNSNFNYNDKVGEIFYIEDGEKYFRDGKLDRNKIQGEVRRFCRFYIRDGRFMKVNGTLMNYYFHCKRQCYLFGNRMNMEDNSEEVKIGKAIHEEHSEQANTEIAIENIRLDKLTAEYLTEVKKSDADVEASKWQLIFCLKVLKEKGIEKEGKAGICRKKQRK